MKSPDDLHTHTHTHTHERGGGGEMFQRECAIRQEQVP